MPLLSHLRRFTQTGFIILAIALLAPALMAHAQTPSNLQNLRFSRLAVPIDPVTLRAEGMEIRLWGIKPASSSETQLELRALDMMQKMINDQKVSCKIMSARDVTRPIARCSTATNEDLSIALLQNGLAVRDRGALYGSVFASSYEEAENTAREDRAGIWALALAPDTTPLESILQNEVKFAFAVFMLIMLPVVTMGVVAVILRGGFRKMLDYQKEQAARQREKEQALHRREKTLLLAAVENELEENKAKVEAFLTVYMEMLSNIKDPDQTPKYQQSGDVISKQPNFVRQAFDANIGPLSTLDMKLSGELGKLYKNIQPRPDYIDLTPSTSREDAISIVEQVISDARSWLPLLDQTIDLVRAHQTTGSEMAA